MHWILQLVKRSLIVVCLVGAFIGVGFATTWAVKELDEYKDYTGTGRGQGLLPILQDGNDATVMIKSLLDIKFVSQNANFAYGIDARSISDTPAVVTVLGHSAIDIRLADNTRGSAVGIWSGDKGRITLNTLNLKAEGQKTYGILAGSDYFNNSPYSGDVVTINGVSTIVVHGHNFNTQEATGLLAMASSQINLNDTSSITVTGDGSNAAGILVTLGGVVTARDLNLDIHAYSGEYKYIGSGYAISPIPLAVGLSANQTASNTSYHLALPYKNEVTKVEIQGKSLIKVTGDRAVAIHAVHKGQIETHLDVDLYVKTANTMDDNLIMKMINNDGVMIGTQAVGIFTTNEGLYTARGSVRIHELEGEEAIGIYAGLGSKVSLEQGIKMDAVNIDPDLTYAVFARSADTEVTIAGGTSIIRGKVIAENQAQIDLSLSGSEAYLYGQTQVQNDGMVNLALMGGARWDNLRDSSLSILSLSGSIYVDMTKNDYNNGGYQKITVGAFMGEGDFKMDTDLAATKRADSSTWDQHSDQLVITGAVAGTEGIGHLQINDASLAAGSWNSNADAYKLLLVTDYTKAAAFKGLRLATGGLYYYTPLIQTDVDDDANRWYLVDITKDGNGQDDPDTPLDPDDPNPNPNPNQPDPVAPQPDPPSPGKPQVTPNGKLPGQVNVAAFVNWRSLLVNDTLLKRMGELRYSQEKGGIWSRIIYGQTKGGNRFNFKNKTTAFQVGIDRKCFVDSGQLITGIAFGYAYTDTDYKGGEGENTDINLAAYGSWISDDNYYIDLVIRGGRITSKYDTYHIMSDHGNNHNWTASVSVEAGRKLSLNGSRQWFLEPQVQFTFGNMWGHDYTTRQNIKVNQKNAQTLVGRVGAVLSREFSSESGLPQRVYLKASVLNEFLGKNNLNLSDSYGDSLRVRDSLKGTWYEVGVGANLNLTERTRLYVDVETGFGSKINMPFRAEAGLRFEF